MVIDLRNPRVKIIKSLPIEAQKSYIFPMKTLGWVLRTRILTASAGFLLSIAGCAKKQETPPTATPPPPVVVPAPEPGKEFADPAQQSNYEGEFHKLLGDFVPPSTGTLFAARLVDGTFIGGALAKLNPTGIVLKIGKQEFVANRSDLDPVSQADLYKDEFAKQYAKAEIMAALATNIATVPTRYALKETLDTLSGPGPRYPAVADLSVPKGARVDVVQRRGRWLQATAPTVKPGVLFWTDIFQTIPLQDDPRADHTPFLLLLLEHGILARINAENSEVYVNEEAWAGTETAVQEGISRLLAAHCAQLKSSGVVLVEIKGDQNNQRLARYSRAQGFRSY